MNHAQSVRIIERIQKLFGQIDRVRQRHPESLLQMPAIGLFHDYIKKTGLFPVSINPDYSRMFEHARRPYFASQLGKIARAFKNFFGNRFQRDLELRSGVKPLIDSPARSYGDGPGYFVFSESFGLGYRTVH